MSVAGELAIACRRQIGVLKGTVEEGLIFDVREFEHLVIMPE